ncbi:MAG: hypothetical protein K9G38_00485 [Bacteroidales bacterium]|nr:hypothetical protein [Bacteroidales bacterium]
MKPGLDIKKIIIFTLILSALLLVLCSRESKLIPLDKIKADLESQNEIEQENPFKIRKFQPYLNDNWIGQAVSYGPYRLGQAPGAKGPSEAEILEDLNIIKQHWNLIRVYNADDDTEKILKVIRDNELPIKVMLGVWLANEKKTLGTKEANIANVLRSIQLANEFSDIIAAVNVGNETQVFWSWHKMETVNLIRYIRAVRNNVPVPVTTADDYNFWNKPESQLVAKEIDFIVTHIYPLWNGKTLDTAIPWLEENYQDVKQKHPEKQIVIGEIGWATDYSADKKGDGEQGSLIKGNVSVETQEKFLIKLDEWVNEQKVTTFLFEVFDEPWKGGGDNSGPNEIEKNWGVFYEDRTPKKSLKNYLNYKKKI